MIEVSEHPASIRNHIAKEQLLLAIARAARKFNMCPAKLGGEAYVAEVETALGLAAVRARLGHAYPHLHPHQDAAVVLVFAGSYEEPTSCSHGGTTHHHHNGTSCSKSGVIHRLVGRLEHKLLSAIGGKKGHRIIAILLRGGALLFCPGDDIAAIGLQVYGSISGQGEHSHHTEQAILPPKVTLQRTVVRQRTPLDN